jgi:hypothetical protein
MRIIISLLFLANLLAFAAAFGAFGPTPAAGQLEPERALSVVHPEWLQARPATADEIADRAVVGGPAAGDTVHTAPLSK